MNRLLLMCGHVYYRADPLKGEMQPRSHHWCYKCSRKLPADTK